MNRSLETGKPITALPRPVELLELLYGRNGTYCGFKYLLSLVRIGAYIEVLKPSVRAAAKYNGKIVGIQLNQFDERALITGNLSDYPEHLRIIPRFNPKEAKILADVTRA